MKPDRNALPIPEANHAPLITVVTLVLWTLSASISMLGVIIPYGRPTPPPPREIPLEAQNLTVELTRDPSPRVDNSLATPAPAELPPPEATVTPIPEAPALTPVADPTVVAFALPVEGPVQVVETARAAYVAPAQPVEPRPAVASPPAVAQITYGVGEGRQPAPEYPYRAQREGQEGTVKIRFGLDENGRVISAEVASASPWPILNQAAVRVVRERWRFRPGSPRLYEVAIRFQLSR